jgi:hypothetical protein
LALSCTLGWGCGIGGLASVGNSVGCAIGDTFSNLFGALGEGSDPETEEVESDDGTYFATVGCTGEGCSELRMLRGVRLALEVDMTENAQMNERLPPKEPESLTFESTAPTIVEVFESARNRDECSGHVWIAGHLDFQAVGEGSVRVLDGGSERARFEFEVAEAASLALATGDRVEGRVGERIPLEAFAFDAQGLALWGGNAIEYSVENSQVASFEESDEPSQAEGPAPRLYLRAAGTTRVHVRASNATAMLVVVIDHAESFPQNPDAGTVP